MAVNNYTEVDISSRFTVSFWDDGDVEIMDHYGLSEAPILLSSDEFTKLIEEHHKFNEK